MTSDHCRVTVQRLFSKFSQIAWNVQKTLFDSRPTVAWPQPLTRDRSATFFKIFPNQLERPKNVVWQSADGRVTSDHCRVTVQWLFSKKFLIAWNVEKTLFDSRPTVAWPPTTVAWPFSDFFQKNLQIHETSKKRCLTVVRRSRDLRPTTVAWPFSDFFSKFSQIAWNVQKTLFDSRPTIAWPQPLSRDRSATCFKIFPNRLERPKNVVWQSADGRVTSDHCRVTVQRLFSKKFLIALNVEKTLFDSRPTVAWPPTTVAWPFSDFFQKFSQLLDSSENSCLTVGRRSRHLRLGWKVEQILFESQRTVTWRSCYFAPVVFFRTASHTASQMYISFFFLLSAEQLGHVSPPTGMVQSWKFWHHMKARDK